MTHVLRVPRRASSMAGRAGPGPARSPPVRADHFGRPALATLSLLLRQLLSGHSSSHRWRSVSPSCWPLPRLVVLVVSRTLLRPAEPTRGASARSAAGRRAAATLGPPFADAPRERGSASPPKNAAAELRELRLYVAVANRSPDDRRPENPQRPAARPNRAPAAPSATAAPPTTLRSGVPPASAVGRNPVCSVAHRRRRLPHDTRDLPPAPCPHYPSAPRPAEHPRPPSRHPQRRRHPPEKPDRSPRAPPPPDEPAAKIITDARPLPTASAKKKKNQRRRREKERRRERGERTRRESEAPRARRRRGRRARARRRAGAEQRGRAGAPAARAPRGTARPRRGATAPRGAAAAADGGRAAEPAAPAG